MILKTAFEKIFRARERAARLRPGADDGYDPQEKPFLDHLEDLRITLAKIGATLAIFTVLAFTFHVQIFELVQYPAKITEVSEGVSLWDRTEFITLAPQEMLMLMLKVSFFAGIIFAFPLIVYFLFQFILPGLRQTEKRLIIPGATVGFLLFLTGVSFAFFLATPIALKFFYVFENERISKLDPGQEALKKPIAELPLIGVDGVPYEPIKGKVQTPETSPDNKTDSTLTPEMREEIRSYVAGLLTVQKGTNLALRYDNEREKIVILQVKGGTSVLRIGEYIKFVTRLVLVFGISFQLPVIVSILVKLELLTARVMRATRTYAWIIIMVASAILTPPDVMTLALLAGPMILLYEICVIIASIMEKRREKRERAEEETYRKRMAELYEKPAEDLTEAEKEELHQAEIEQYEKEHAHLYEDENEHGDLDHDDPHNMAADHDEHWHEDHQYQDHDPHHGDEDFHPVQDWPDQEELVKDGMESDHAEPQSMDAEEEEQETDSSEFHDNDACEPDGPVIDLNHAEIHDLKTLPGIGDKLAEVIIQHRPFETFDDVERVPGIGPEKLAKMIHRLMLG